MQNDKQKIIPFLALAKPRNWQWEGNVEQGSAEWLKLRKNYLGASDAPVVMGVSPWRTPYELWQEKLGLIAEPVETPAMRRGKELESTARLLYEEHTGIAVRPTIVFHPAKKFMMASLDGLSEDRKSAVEIKAPCQADHDKAKSGKVPEKYVPQLQHQMACLDLNYLHYFSYRDGNFILLEVERDQQYINQLYEKEEAFWNCVLNLDPPELIDRDYVLIDDPEWEKLAQGWIGINEKISILEKEEKEYRLALIQKSQGKNARGRDVLLTKVIRKGAIDYGGIPELIDVDLERYRKDPVETWRVQYRPKKSYSGD